jgi:hypothetical protein
MQPERDRPRDLGGREAGVHAAAVSATEEGPAQAPASFRVNFLIVGAQKCGTTALARFLSAHPSICIAPDKEAHFFDPENAHGDDHDWGTETTNERYRSHFPNFSGQPVVGEATPIYVYLPEVPERIRRYNPAMKLIFLVREPGLRAVSQFQHERRNGRERLPFWTALAAEGWRLRRDRRDRRDTSSVRRHSYVDRGRYGTQLARLYRHFPREQVLVITSEELWGQHESSLRRVYAFLNLPEPPALPPRERHFAFPEVVHCPHWCRLLVNRLLRSEVRLLERQLGRGLAGWY